MPGAVDSGRDCRCPRFRRAALSWPGWRSTVCRAGAGLRRKHDCFVCAVARTPSDARNPGGFAQGLQATLAVQVASERTAGGGPHNRVRTARRRGVRGNGPLTQWHFRGFTPSRRNSHMRSGGQLCGPRQHGGGLLRRNSHMRSGGQSRRRAARASARGRNSHMRSGGQEAVSYKDGTHLSRNSHMPG